MKFFFPILGLLSLFLQSCNDNAPVKRVQTDNSMAAMPIIKSQKVQNKAEFKLQIDKPQSADFKEIYQLLKSENVLQQFIYDMSQRIEFPGEVKIEVAECDEVNAFYNPENSTITICYEFLERMMSIQDKTLSSRDKLLHAAAFTFLHEMGHALVDKLDLPITGKEENAVDELAMVLLMSDTTDHTYFAALEGALQFYEDALDEDLKKYPFYAVHAPSLERYFDMLTLIVGAEPETAKEFVGKGEHQLHPDRAESAENEYHKKLDSWKRLLGDAWKGD